jgi:hypothetical protein
MFGGHPRAVLIHIGGFGYGCKPKRFGRRDRLHRHREHEGDGRQNRDQALDDGRHGAANVSE